MTPELTALALAALLQFVQYALMAIPTNLELGPRVTMSPRDAEQMATPMANQVSRGTGRLIRALNNHFEGLILFAIACTVVAVSGQSTSVTAGLAFTYLAARLLYIPAYYFGWVPWRSLIWAVGFLATGCMLLAALI